MAGLVLVLLAALAAVLIPHAASGAEDCDSGLPSKSILVSPPNGELPVKSSVMLEATVGVGGLPTAAAGQSVVFRVVCGPDEGHSVTEVTSRHSQASGVPTAAFTLQNDGHEGDDYVMATTKFNGQTSSRTVVITWGPRLRSCDPSLGWFAALKCRTENSQLGIMVNTALAAGQCTLAAGSFLLPEVKLVKVYDAAKRADTAEHAAVSVGATTSFGDLINDLRTLGGGFSRQAVWHTFKHAHSAAGLVDHIWQLVHALPAGEAARVGVDLLNIAGLGSCVDLVKDIIRNTSSGGAGTPSGGSGACSGTVLAAVAKKSLVSQHVATADEMTLYGQYCAAGWAVADVGTTVGGGYGESILFHASAQGWKDVAESNVIVAGEAGLPESIYEGLVKGLDSSPQTEHVSF